MQAFILNSLGIHIHKETFKLSTIRKFAEKEYNINSTYLILPLFVLYLMWLHNASNIPLVVVTYRQSNTCKNMKNILVPET